MAGKKKCQLPLRHANECDSGNLYERWFPAIVLPESLGRLTGSGLPAKQGRMKKSIALLPGAQGSYFLLTGLWPVADIDSFMLVTGPKADIWLVKMVGLLAASAGLTLLYYARKGTDNAARILGSFTAFSFLAVDVYYVVARVIPVIYLADAAVELIFICWWVLHASRRTGAS